MYAPPCVLVFKREEKGYSITARWQDVEENKESPLNGPTKVVYDDAQHSCQVPCF